MLTPEGEAMVEIKYDESKSRLKLPKNIRQVGRPDSQIKIYVEDYVVTYINQIAQESPLEERLAILLGDMVLDEESAVVFIHGAIAVEQVNIQDEHIGFTSSIWSKIYDDIKKYFGEAKVVGWFLTRPGKSLRITEKITKIHVDNFPGEGKTLFVSDPVDDDEAFYIYRRGELVRQDGYYIYYDRNEAMQNYMIESKQVSLQEDRPDGTDKREKDVNADISSASKTQKTQETRKRSRMTMNKMTKYASMAVFLVIVAAGALVVQRENQKIREIPVNAGALEGTIPVETAQDDAGEAESTDGETRKEEASDSEETSEASESESDAQNEADSDSAQPTMQPTAIAGTSYTVADGDTLAGISRRFYNSLAYVNEICRINGIEDADMVYPGMTITLP